MKLRQIAARVQKESTRVPVRARKKSRERADLRRVVVVAAAGAAGAGAVLLVDARWW